MDGHYLGYVSNGRGESGPRTVDFMVPVHFFFALRPAIFSVLSFVTRSKLIQEMIVMFGAEEVVIGGRRRGVHGANKFQLCRCCVDVVSWWRSPMHSHDGQRPWFRDLEPCLSEHRN